MIAVLPIFSEKIGVFLEKHMFFQILQRIAVFCKKTPQNFGENIFKIGLS
jgi:hypothetical protein